METIEQRLRREIERVIDASGVAGYETALTGQFQGCPASGGQVDERGQNTDCDWRADQLRPSDDM
jgi:hypothetical protein